MKMRKMILAVMAFVALCACNSDKKDLAYRGLSMGLPFQAFCDSLNARGFAMDSAKSDTTGSMIVMANPATNYRLALAQKEGKIVALQENYKISTNDSTRHLWQQLRDQFEKELGSWPNCPILKDDHKVAKFETDGGFVTVTLENTYVPTLSVLYEVKK
jgi:hypothetical protein